MAKLLKPLVVIVLLLGIAAIVIQAAFLFPKRVLIKERTQKLENGILTVVNTLKGDRSLLSDEAKSQARFNVASLRVDHKDNLVQVDTELNRANAVANAVLEGWQFTQVDLENTRQDLENTRAELENTKAQLEDARTQIVQLNETIREKNQELEEKSALIAELEEEKASLNSEIATLKDQIMDMENQLADLQERNSLLQAQLDKCEGQLNPTGNITMKPGTTGSIVYVNPDWNFVVINIGIADGAQTTAELIVHRGENMIGKVKLSAVMEHVAIAEVLSDFQKDTIKEGDNVLF
ncbi:MAG TPA: hypothetical protein P5169_04570 [Kiritimatiellia bacterium]|jgi:peptidoglycan hydrolase CwlO-like protein|nr:hypothetical protein [Lentisphaerota bacterium]HRV30960.1 hypothetical protein [Kiritimatiellia bacterium]